ncbi:MAG: transposase [Deltaproteobacteria bacterium]|nr:transposase [Deltaproteobacteria bacterium]
MIQQLREAFPYEEAPRHLIFDRDSIFSRTVVRTIKSFDTKPARTAYRSPWQNPFAERWVRSVREEMLDHVVILGEEHLWELMRAYVRYHNVDRPHYSLKQKDAPIFRQIQQRPSSDAKVIAFPRGCGIHHRYEWREAA